MPEAMLSYRTALALFLIFAGCGEDSSTSVLGAVDDTPAVEIVEVPDVASGEAIEASDGDAADAIVETDSHIQVDVGPDVDQGEWTPCDGTHPCEKGVCDPAAHVCLGCLVSGDCPTPALCFAGTCVPTAACTGDVQCKSTGKVCNQKLGLCVDCNSAADCALNETCIDSKCIAAKACASSKDCPAACDPASKLCVQCVVDGDCQVAQYCTPAHACQVKRCTNSACVDASEFLCKPSGAGFEASTICTDGNGCTADTCEAKAGCVFKNQAGPCDDGDACTKDDTCANGGCTGANIACDDKNACTSDSCDMAQGCLFKPVASACDDGKECTVNDACVSGACTGDLNPCADGNLCTSDACAEPGGCSFAALSGSCSDGDACTFGDACAGGTCASGTPVSCDDKNACTSDSCDSLTGCKHVTTDGASCDDGKTCTGPDACNGTSCTGAAIPCEDKNLCTVDSCAEPGGCTFGPVGGTCEDGDACTSGDICAGGKCTSGDATNCDDGNTCTADTCDTASGCKHAPLVGDACDDQSACTSGDMCASGTCTGQSIACNDYNMCTDDGCEPASGCAFANNVLPCDDAKPCTANDACGGGTCAGTTPTVCDDLNQCTTDTCDPVMGCVFTATPGAKCDDGEFCTLNDACDVTACTGAPNPCDDANVCTSDACVGQACEHPSIVDGTGCGMFDGCTGDWCAGGTCLKGKDRLWDTSIPYAVNPGGDVPYAVAHAPDGGFVVAGESPSTGVPTGWLAKLDATGKILWSQTYGSTGERRFRGVAVGSDGTIAAVGEKPDNGVDGWILLTDKDGTVVSSQIVGTSQKDRLNAVVSHPSGGWVAAGTRGVVGSSGKTTAWVIRIGTTGGVVWDTAYPSAYPYAGLNALLVQPNGSITATGWAGNLSASCSLLTVNASGAQLSSATDVVVGTCNGIAIAGDGYALVGNDSKTGFFHRTDPQGNQLAHSKAISITWPPSNVEAIAALGSGLFLIGGEDGKAVPFYYVVDDSGTVMWPSYGTWQGPGKVTAIQAQADGTAVVQGILDLNNVGDAFIRHFDAINGNTTCAADGNCISLAANACDDSNPCTYDVCQKSQCTHVNVNDGASCAPAALICQNGKCVDPG